MEERGEFGRERIRDLYIGTTTIELGSWREDSRGIGGSVPKTAGDHTGSQGPRKLSERLS